MPEPPVEQVPGPYEDTTCQMVAAYGTKDHPHLDSMRAFRDTVLSENLIGRKLTQLYYRASPPIARLLTQHRSVARIFRTLVGRPLHLFSRFFV